MYCVISFCLLICTFLILVSSDGDIGPGVWYVKSVSKCPDNAAFDFQFDVKKSKVNRTCDGFNVEMTIHEDIDDSFACRIEVCKHVDGGCKPYQVIADDSIARLIKKYAEGNFRNVLELAGFENCDFPIAKGQYEVKQYIINACELPPQGMYGEFDAITYMVKNSVDVACIIATVEFKEDNCLCAPEGEECE